MDEDLDLIDTNPGAVRAKAYDIVLNGYELGGGSIRIHRRDIQKKMFELLGFSDEDAQERFGFLLMPSNTAYPLMAVLPSVWTELSC